MKKVIVLLLISISYSSFAFTFNLQGAKSLCGVDDRVFSYDQKIGRAQDSVESRGGCSITMIGKSCAITAGHCKDILKVVEFNPRHPDARGLGGHSSSDEVYEIDQNSIESVHSYAEDWAVFKILPHSTSGRLAGEVYGTYPVSFIKPHRKDIVRITGYGVDRNHPERYCTQQTHSGKITKLGMFSDNIEYKVDTEPGNSGSAVILESTGEIVAIHTNGGCSEYDGRQGNGGTMIANNKKLQRAITSCLSSELPLQD